MLDAVVAQDFDVLREVLAPNVIQYYQRPVCRRDDGKIYSDRLIGSENIIEEIRDNFYVTLYRKGTVTVNIERFISSGDWVAAQFSLKARTFRANEDYENFYFFLYHTVGNKIVEYWEYVDSAYADKMLYPDKAVASIEK
jgi:ketosteroid isomerase-like protein